MTKQDTLPPLMGRAQIREIFMRNGFTIKDGQTDLKDYVYSAAEELVRAALAAQAPHPPEPQPVRDPLSRELMGLCESIVKFHKERGAVLKIHIENMDDLLQEMAAGITKDNT